MNLLETIHGHQDLAALSPKGRKELCEEIRGFLVDHVAKTGGHLASNLGVVELTVAIETVFDTAKDRLVFDVGHQSYVHKILTDRKEGFDRLRQFGGIAGFPKPSESDTDAFVAGHASNSVSVALGMARARSRRGEQYNVLALIGDGATTGGLCYEGLNDAGDSGEPLIVILNDNEMSIARNVGGVAQHLSRLLTGGCTAIICSHDMLANSVLVHCAEMGLRIPEDISILGFDDIPLCRYTTPPLSTIRQDRTGLGKSSFFALSSHLNNAHLSTYLLHAELIQRASCAEAPQTLEKSPKQKTDSSR